MKLTRTVQFARVSVALAVAVLLFIAACYAVNDVPMGVLAGTVTKGPVTPAVRPGLTRPSEVAGAQVDIATDDGKPVSSVKTDSGGLFSLKLPAGTYRITMPSLYGAMFTRDLPATVIITANHETRLDIHLDTGIR